MAILHDVICSKTKIRNLGWPSEFHRKHVNLFSALCLRMTKHRLVLGHLLARWWPCWGLVGIWDGHLRGLSKKSSRDLFPGINYLGTTIISGYPLITKATLRISLLSRDKDSYVYTFYIRKQLWLYSANTLLNNNVIITSKRHRDVVLT